MTNKQLSKEEIMKAIRSAAETLGRTPSRSKFISLKGISEHKILKHFPSWNEAVKASGLKPDLSNIKIKDDELLKDWAELVRKLRQIPTRTQYQQHGNYSSGVFEHHFGPWSSLPNKFRKFAGDNQEWIDVLSLLPAKKPWAVSTILYNIKQEDSQVKPNSYYKRKKHTKLQNRQTYGDPLDFRGLRHEPVNESGVIFLFGMVARELGYMVEAVQEGYPDCEAKRQIDNGKWQSVKIEFEYESRNFRDHGHPPENCDVIVCWRHNWQDCPPNLEILELRSIIESLAKSDD